jgi:hypothetical protein
MKLMHIEMIPASEESFAASSGVGSRLFALVAARIHYLATVNGTAMDGPVTGMLCRAEKSRLLYFLPLGIGTQNAAMRDNVSQLSYR